MKLMTIGHNVFGECEIVGSIGGGGRAWINCKTAPYSYPRREEWGNIILKVRIRKYNT